MPKAIIKKSTKEYSKEGKSIYFAAANKQKRDKETFHKRKAR